MPESEGETEAVRRSFYTHLSQPSTSEPYSCVLVFTRTDTRTEKGICIQSKVQERFKKSLFPDLHLPFLKITSATRYWISNAYSGSLRCNVGDMYRNLSELARFIKEGMVFKLKAIIAHGKLVNKDFRRLLSKVSGHRGCCGIGYEKRRHSRLLVFWGCWDDIPVHGCSVPNHRFFGTKVSCCRIQIILFSFWLSSKVNPRQKKALGVWWLDSHQDSYFFPVRVSMILLHSWLMGHGQKLCQLILGFVSGKVNSSKMESSLGRIRILVPMAVILIIT